MSVGLNTTGSESTWAAEMKNGLLMDCACLVFRAFQKLRKANSNFVMLFVSVRPSVRMEQLGAHWTNFH